MNQLSNRLAKVIADPTFPEKKKFRSLHPSSASVVTTTPIGPKVVGACHRQQYLRMKGVQSEGSVNIDWMLSAIMGEKMHDLIIELIDHYGFSMGLQKITREHGIYNNLINLAGRSDLILWDYIAKEPIGVEIKSIGEYKAKKAIEEPIEEHVLQSIIYLDFYNKQIPDNQVKIRKWYIWYISRTENWSIKGKDHNSPFSMLWDYCIELDNGIPVIELGNGAKQKWNEFAIDRIYERYNILKDAVDKDKLPDRDYQISYSEEKITALHSKGMLKKKGDIEAVEKWLKKGAPPGKLKITMGDQECKFCEYSKLCWEGEKTTKEIPFSNLPPKDIKPKQDKTMLI